MESVLTAPRCVIQSRTARTDQMSRRKSAVRGLPLRSMLHFHHICSQVKALSTFPCCMKCSAALQNHLLCVRQSSFCFSLVLLESVVHIYCKWIQAVNVAAFCICHNKMWLPPSYYLTFQRLQRSIQISSSFRRSEQEPACTNYCQTIEKASSALPSSLCSPSLPMSPHTIIS